MIEYDHAVQDCPEAIRMIHIPSTEAKSRFGELLRLLRTGESFIITQNGEEAGRLMPPVRGHGRRMSIEKAIETICGLRPVKPLRPDEIRDLIEDGRRF
jgi:prevent-host-death family protein